MEYLFLLALTMILFSKSVNCGYVVDDDVRRAKMTSLKADFKEKWKSPKWFIKFMWNALSAGGVFQNAKQEYIFNATLHFINCSLIYRVSGSLLAAALYLVNPVNNQIALWMNGRRYAISIFLALMVMNFKILFIPLYVVIVWLHVSAVALPVLMLSADNWWKIILAGLVFLKIGFPWIKNYAVSRSRDFAPGNENQKIHPKKLIIYIKSAGWYFFHTIIPNKPRMFHEWHYYFTRYPEEMKRGYSLNFDFWKGLAVLGFIGYEVIGQGNFWALWWIVFISQWCGVYTVTMDIADRYCSLAGVGLMIVLAKYIVMLPAEMQLILCAFLFTFYFLRYQPLFKAYQSHDDFMWYHINIQPDSVEARVNLHKQYMLKKDPFRAFAIIKDGIIYRPTDFKLLLAMAGVLFCINKRLEAFKVLEIAKRNLPIGEPENFMDDIADAVGESPFKPKKPEVPLNRQQRRAAERAAMKGR